MQTQSEFTWSWHVAGDQGRRAVNADAVASHTDPATGGLHVALADGIGDNQGAVRAALVAAAAAVRTPAAAGGPAAALLAAQRAVLADPDAGDCVLVIAQPRVDGYELSWVGDVRAYAWDGSALRQLTTDHTLAQFFRSRGEPFAPRMEHLVTTSVRTARPTEFGRAQLLGPGRLLLTSDGVHKTLPPETMAEIMRYADNPAAALVAAAHRTGSTDNATAVTVDHVSGPPPLPLPTMPIPTAA